MLIRELCRTAEYFYRENWVLTLVTYRVTHKECDFYEDHKLNKYDDLKIGF